MPSYHIPYEEYTKIEASDITILYYIKADEYSVYKSLWDTFHPSFGGVVIEAWKVFNHVKENV